jgi:soluble lytic murein transglycosylase
MSFLRACLLSTALVAVAAAQPAPVDVVMMPPMADATSFGAGLTSFRPSRLKVLGAADHELFLRAFDAAAHGDWAGARALAAQGSNPMARRLLEWRFALDKTSGATFEQIDAVIKDTDALKAKDGGAAAWPLRGTLQARAEAALQPGMDAAAIVQWFGTRSPNSSIGKIRLGEALVATGEKSRGGKLIREGWAEGSFDQPTEQGILAKDTAYLTPESDRQRLDALIWRGESSAARRQMGRVDDGTARIADARIALTGGVKRAKKELARVAGSDDPALLFDWAHGLRIDNMDSEAHARLLQVPATPMVKDHAARWWGECNIQARDALANGDPAMALKIVQHAGFTSGDQYAEAQFLAGFIALRFLKEPATALSHFQKLEAGVSRPISKSRALFWEGRALEAQGAADGALAHYRQAAASYPETFYGQVAMARIDATPSIHLNETPVEAAGAAELADDPLWEEIRVLADLGQEGSLRLFIDRDVEVYSSPRHIKRLMLLLEEWGYPEIAVRLAKTASYGGTYMPAFTHPVIALPPYVGPGGAPEAALVLGVIRQETEFDAFAVSSANARGLMQMVPASGKLAAKANGQPWRPEALLTDTAYNIQLGMTEWRGHLDHYNGNWVLATAAYNAGPGNVTKWLARNGDPRTGDPIDWIEQISFPETRNYVQRVLENTEVYRVRLANGRDVPLRILSDLYGPDTPRMGVLVK